jgi:xanthine dehydrogenase molybdopterin-binding subunit B
LVGGTVRSPVPHGVLRGIRFDPAFDWNLVTVVTAQDIPGQNVCPIVYRDQPVLAFDRVRYDGDPIALIAAADEETLQRALDAVTVDVEPLESIFDARIAQNAPDHLFRRIEIKKGNTAEALATAAVVVEGEYETGAQEHLYLEPQGIQAERDGDGIVLRGSMQCPYYLVEAVAVVLGIAESQVRVVPCAAGGGFGGKEDFPSLLAGHAALLAWKCGWCTNESRISATPANVIHRGFAIAQGSRRMGASSPWKWTCCLTAAPTARSAPWFCNDRRCMPPVRTLAST